MAIVNNGTKVSIPADDIPSGYVKPTITEVSGDELYVNHTTITVLKSAVENANAVSAFTALVSAINTAAAALIDIAFTTTETTTFYTDFVALSDNQVVESVYTTDAEEFYATVAIYVQVVEVT